MKPKARAKKIRKIEHKLVRQHRKLGEMKRKSAAEPVEDHEFAEGDGLVKLSALFGKKRALIVVHNMGRSCPYCTLWADGYNGLVPHLDDRAAFVVVSPDTPRGQREFARGRGWKFRLISDRSGKFSTAMGFKSGADWMPGVSTFRKKGGKIQRVASAPFGPFDPFCAAWHFFNLLDGGVGDWIPKYSY